MNDSFFENNKEHNIIIDKKSFFIDLVPLALKKYNRIKLNIVGLDLVAYK